MSHRSLDDELSALLSSSCYPVIPGIIDVVAAVVTIVVIAVLTARVIIAIIITCRAHNPSAMSRLSLRQREEKALHAEVPNYRHPRELHVLRR